MYRTNSNRHYRRNDFNNHQLRKHSGNRPTIKDIIRSKDPETFDLSAFLRSSSELKRHVGLAIIENLRKQNKLDSEDKCYVYFDQLKFTIKINNMGTDMNYSSILFVKSFYSALQSYSYQAQHLISTLYEVNYNETVDKSELSKKEVKDEITEIASLVIKHISENNNNNPLEE